MRSRVWWSVGICQLLIHYWNMHISYFVQKYQTCQQLRFFDLIQHLFTLYYHKFTISRSVISQHWFLSLPLTSRFKFRTSNINGSIFPVSYYTCFHFKIIYLTQNGFFLGFFLISPMKKIKKLCKAFKKKIILDYSYRKVAPSISFV